MTALSAVETITHGLRVWGAFAALLFLLDLCKPLKAWLHLRRTAEAQSIWWDMLGKVCVALFTLLAGSAIPFTQEYLGKPLDDPALTWTMMFAWAFVSSGAWGFVIGRAHRRRYMIASAAVGLAVIILAAFLVVKGA